MNNSLKQDSVKEMINMLKGDYNFPVKLWVWGKLCDLCQNEVKKANNELVQLLNEEGSDQTINQPEDIRN